MAYATISKPSLHFNTKVYTGTGSATSITGVGFQPDWVWIKRRDASTSNTLFDVIRGTTKRIMTNETAAEETDAQSLTAFDTDGFSLGTNASVNNSGSSHVSFNWKAANSQGSSNTDGSINTTYTSVNTTSGFSISQYTGTGSNATIGHGLGVAPRVVIIKRTSNTSQWVFGHKSLGFTKFLELNLTGVAQTNSNRFNDTNPTSSVFSIGTENDVNASGQTYIAYCFAEKKGYSKFGSYTGNGNADGTFIYTGFKPAWIMTKRATGTANEWYIYDNKRTPTNPSLAYIVSNTNSAENAGSSQDRDMLSNGFKIRNGNAAQNSSGSTYIYMAFAEEPLVANVGSGTPATAR